MLKFGACWRLMRFDRPIGTLLLLWPSMWALWLAAGANFPPLDVLMVFVLGVIVMRAAGCVINDIADRHFDGHVTRTQYRPLVTGEIGVRAAWVLFVLLSFAALMLVLMLNTLTVLLSFVAIILAATYPFAKRYIAVPQLVLAAAFSWGVPMAFAALTDYVPAVAWLLFAAAYCWTVAYDTAYAMCDREDDLKIGLYSSAIFFGRFNRLCIALLQCLMMVLLALVGYMLNLNAVFFITLLLVVCFFMYQHYLLARATSQYCLRAFLNNNWVGAVIFFGVACSF